MNFFAPEYADIHNEHEQLRRQKSASKLTMDSIDFANQIQNISDDAKLELREFTHNPKKRIYKLSEHRGCYELISEGLLIARSVSVDDVIEKLTITEIKNLCEGNKPKKGMKRAEVVNFFKENYPESAEELAKIYGTGKAVLELPQEIVGNLVAINRFVCSFVGPMPNYYF